jgi:hypothetical protein
VILIIEKHKVSHLIDTIASISAIPFSPGPGPYMFRAYKVSPYSIISLSL